MLAGGGARAGHDKLMGDIARHCILDFARADGHVGVVVANRAAGSTQNTRALRHTRQCETELFVWAYIVVTTNVQRDTCYALSIEFQCAG